MLLLLMRHGIAEDARAFVDDASRTLTSQGIRRTHHAARGLKQLVPRLDVLISSPKIRALQTAAQVREVYQCPAALQWPELASDDFQTLRRKLRELNQSNVLCVGHEPHLSDFASYLLAQKTFEMNWKKAGVCALEVDEKVEAATLLWFLPPRFLRGVSS